MVVIGAGRVGTALTERSRSAGIDVALVTRTTGWEAIEREAPGEPVLVAVRNDDLDGVLAKVPARRRDDLVFVQNGMIRPWLRDHQLAQATRGLLFLAVNTRGGPIEPSVDSPFCGPHAAEVVHWFGKMQIPARVVEWARFTALELEKLVWNCAFGVLCEATGEDVGGVVERHQGDLDALVTEFQRVGRASMGVDLDHAFLMERLCAYSLSIPTWKGSVKDEAWRNGWFERTAREFGIATPVHQRLLAAAGKPQG